MGKVTTTAIPKPPVARVVGALLAMLALLATMVLSATPADAHARLEGSSPSDGATLAAVPPEVTLRFNEPIEEGLNQVSVKSGSTEVAQGDPQVEGSNVYQPIDFSMEPGEYTVTYKVVSADGHPVSGSFTFTYEPPAGDGTVEEDGEATPFEPSESETSSETGDEPSETATTEPSETSTSEPSETSSESTDEDATPAPEEGTEAGTEGTSPWWWALAVAALALVVGGLVVLVRGRRDTDEDIDLDE